VSGGFKAERYPGRSLARVALRLAGRLLRCRAGKDAGDPHTVAPPVGGAIGDAAGFSATPRSALRGLPAYPYGRAALICINALR
jgi:hypothetical protein